MTCLNPRQCCCSPPEWPSCPHRPMQCCTTSRLHSVIRRALPLVAPERFSSTFRRPPQLSTSLNIGGGDSRFVSLDANVDGGVFHFAAINFIGMSNGIWKNISANEVLSTNGLTLGLSTGGLGFVLYGVNNSGVG